MLVDHGPTPAAAPTRSSLNFFSVAAVVAALPSTRARVAAKLSVLALASAALLAHCVNAMAPIPIANPSPPASSPAAFVETPRAFMAIFASLMLTASFPSADTPSTPSPPAPAIRVVVESTGPGI